MDINWQMNSPWRTSEPVPDNTPWELPGDARVTITLDGIEHVVVEMKPDGPDALVKLESGRCLRLKNVGPPTFRMAGSGEHAGPLILSPPGPWPY